MGWQQTPSDPAIDELDDDQLIELIQENPDLFKVLYERYFQAVYRYCLKRSSDVQVAEDLSSEVFIKVMNKLHTYKVGNFPAWLFRIAHNVVVDYYRKQKTVVAIDKLQLTADTKMPSRVANRLLLDDIFAELTEEERELLTLRLELGLSAPEIAAQQGKTANSVRVQIYRLLKRLRDRHQSVMGDDQ